MLSAVTTGNRNSVLNAIYSISPAAFDPPKVQKKLRSVFPSTGTHGLATLNLLRLHRRSNAHKIAVCCMPKSGSSFILSSLKRLEALDFYVAYLHVPYQNPTFVDAVECENEIDEMALLRIELLGMNTLAHTHTKCAPYTEKLLAAHRYKAVVVQRNIFDCIVSMDDMIVKGLVPGFGMFHPPTNYAAMPREERISFLCQYVGPWYIDFVVTWARSRIKPLFLHYDDDVRGFDETTAQKIQTYLGLDQVSQADFKQAFQLSAPEDKKQARLNVGVSGRGQDIPQIARDNIRRLADVYAHEADFTGLL